MNRSLLLAMAGLATASSAFAETSHNTANTIIVTATRTAESADETLTSVTVFTREDIEQSQASNLMELLQSQATGLDFSRNGGPGSTTSLFIRGTESNHVLVLIDGVRASSATTGSFNWNTLPPEQIERIEIVRGPASTQYGADAIGGVVHIFTRQLEAPTFKAGAGSFNSWNASAGTGGALGKGQYNINLSLQESAGFSNANPKNSRYNADDDGFDNSSITAGFSLPIGNTTDFSAKLLHAEGMNEYDSGSTNAHIDTLNQTLDLKLDWYTTSNWQQTFNAGYAVDELKNFSSTTSEITTQRSSFSWQNDVQFGQYSLVTLGIDYLHEDAENKSRYDKSTNNRALFAQYQWQGNDWDLLIGARGDDHSAYGRHDTGRIAIGHRVGKGRIHVNYGTAFKAPTFNELYWPGYGNPDIKPEESKSAEVGYRQGGFSMAVFQTDIENLISGYPVENIDKAHIKGLEAGYSLTVNHWQLKTGITLQTAEDDNTGEKLTRRADKKLQFSANGPVTGNTHGGIEVNYVGERDDKYGFPSTRTELPSYTLVNLTSSTRLSPELKLNVHIENLLDEDYELAYGYNTAGISGYINLVYQPK